ncbi:F0F1 ATP synthase subunit gamma, partial [Mycoplasmopsis pullorum]|uniref:F0F1 ATP synthase subunit gamma n=1 Tax=Mycoplasmopsis pullorum TaxID=48003 RepID=UPI00111BBC15
GLCVSYKSNIFNLLKTTVNKQDKLIVFGAKGISNIYYSWMKDLMIHEIANYGEKLEYNLTNSVAKIALELFEKGEISSIKVIYTKFINNVVQTASCAQLLPIEKENFSSRELGSEIEFEPDPQTVLKNAIPLYISSLIYSLGISSKVSEMASRRNAMENSTDNADELLNDLHLEFNRTRQSLITQEISEIVSGADAT